MSNFLKKSLPVLLGAVLIISFCYLYVDRSFAFWSHEQNFARYAVLKNFTRVIEVLEHLIPIFYLYFIFQFFHKRTTAFDKKLLIIANSVVLTYFIKDQLKLVFGRYWPQTWTHGNPSLIDNNAYGFNFLHSGSWYQSFPSGHSALTFAAAAAIWITFPRCRWLAVLLTLFTVIGQLSMNYHFVSDVIAGGLLGTLIAYCTARIMNKESLSQAALVKTSPKSETLPEEP